MLSWTYRVVDIDGYLLFCCLVPNTDLCFFLSSLHSDSTAVLHLFLQDGLHAVFALGSVVPLPGGELRWRALGGTPGSARRPRPESGGCHGLHSTTPRPELRRGTVTLQRLYGDAYQCPGVCPYLTLLNPSWKKQLCLFFTCTNDFCILLNDLFFSKSHQSAQDRS